MPIVTIGPGYVGLPRAVALGDHFETLGYDIGASGIDELRSGRDRTGELSPERPAALRLHLSANADDMRGADVLIVSVPMPLDVGKRPGLGAVVAASETVGARFGRGAIVVFESMV